VVRIDADRSYIDHLGKIFRSCLKNSRLDLKRQEQGIDPGPEDDALVNFEGVTWMIIYTSSCLGFQVAETVPGFPDVIDWVFSMPLFSLLAFHFHAENKYFNFFTVGSQRFFEHPDVKHNFKSLINIFA